MEDETTTEESKPATMAEAKEIFTSSPEEMPWENADFFFGTEEEERKKSAYPVFADNIYIAELTDIKMVQRPGYQTEELETQIEANFRLLKDSDGGEVVYDDGTFADRTFFKAWFGVNRTGYNKKTGMAVPLRQFMTAIQGLPPTAAFSAPNPEKILGKKVKLVVEVGHKQNGDKKNVVNKYMIAK